MSEVKTLKDLIRTHHETGEPRDAHLKLTTRALADIPKQQPGPQQTWMSQPLGMLMGLSLVLDDDMLDGWQLVDTQTGNILARGSS